MAVSGGAMLSNGSRDDRREAAPSCRTCAACRTQWSRYAALAAVQAASA